MSGSTGGLFAHKLTLRAYFVNAAGLKDGAPVTLEGVTIGNVIHVRVVSERNPTPVEVVMQVGEEYIHDLHKDSTAAIAQAGVLGDSYVDISSAQASGPPPTSNTELKTTTSPSIQDVVRTSQTSIEQIQVLEKKLEILVDSLNSNKGTIGALINDPEMAHKVTSIAADLQTITHAIANGKGSLGKLVNDDTLYSRANAAVEQLSRITADLEAGKGTAGKLLKDDTLYTNLNATLAGTNQLVGEINAGKGAVGKFAKDPAFAQKLDDTVSRLDSILTTVEQGKGSIGQLLVNKSLYDNADATLAEAHGLVKDIRANPKKYLVIRLKLF
jgi:phospholipid/cholesterol/gamma-HCH transport system substrate-binding protein